jgi:hypothetical protein
MLPGRQVYLRKMSEIHRGAVRILEEMMNEQNG